MSAQTKTSEFVLDINSGQLWCGDDEIKLAPQAFALLRFLMAHPGCLLSKNAILDGVWPDRAVNEEVVRDCIRDLRKALGDNHHAPRFIETVHKRGYRYTGAIKINNATPENANDKANVKLSIAVLPFDNLSGDSSKDLLASGITESLITTLAMMPELGVVARHSSEVWRNQKVSINQIAEALKVRYILTGSVKYFGTQIRVTAQLCDGFTGYHLWAKEYAYTAEDWLQLQDEFSWQVATELEVLLYCGEMARLWRKQTRHAEAYRYFLYANKLIEQHDPFKMRQAQELLGKAVALDKSFASAWVALGQTYNQQARLSFVKDPLTAWEQARTCLQQALLADPEDVRAHFMSGAIHSSRGENQKGLVQMEKNIHEHNHYADNLSDYAIHLCYAGRPQEALICCREASRLSPNCPPFYEFARGLALLQLGHYERANDAFHKAAPSEGARPMARSGLIYSYVCLERMDKARAEMAHLLSVHPSWNTAKVINAAPFKNPLIAQDIVTQLRKAGLPE